MLTGSMKWVIKEVGAGGQRGKFPQTTIERAED